MVNSYTNVEKSSVSPRGLNVLNSRQKRRTHLYYYSAPSAVEPSGPWSCAEKDEEDVDTFIEELLHCRDAFSDLISKGTAIFNVPVDDVTTSYRCR